MLEHGHLYFRSVASVPSRFTTSPRTFASVTANSRRALDTWRRFAERFTTITTSVPVRREARRVCRLQHRRRVEHDRFTVFVCLVEQIAHRGGGGVSPGGASGEPAVITWRPPSDGKVCVTSQRSSRSRSTSTSPGERGSSKMRVEARVPHVRVDQQNGPLDVCSDEGEVGGHGRPTVAGVRAREDEPFVFPRPDPRLDARRSERKGSRQRRSPARQGNGCSCFEAHDQGPLA